MKQNLQATVVKNLNEKPSGFLPSNGSPFFFVMLVLLVALAGWKIASMWSQRESQRFAKKLKDIEGAFESALAQMWEQHRAWEKKMDNASIVPRDHALVPLEEGNSFHRLPTGYVMYVERKLEHRYVAEKLLKRGLKVNEVVHHIYGPAKHDNSPKNLCVLDREQHDLFHTFLERELKLKGHWPRIAEQKEWLRKHHNGILLEELVEVT